MADGNNQDDLREAQKKIDELTAKAEKLEQDLAKKQSIVDNAEQKFNDMSNETGENRKALAEAARELTAARKAERETQELVRNLQKELDELRKKIGSKAEEGNNRNEASADDIEASLTEAERKFVESKWKELTEDQREAYLKDDEVRKAALMEAKATVAKAAPDLSSPWKKPAQKTPSGEGVKDEIRKMFQSEAKRARNLPDGSHGGSPRSGSGNQPVSRARREVSGVLG